VGVLKPKPTRKLGYRGQRMEGRMSFDNSTFRKLVKQFGGWIESGVARFPSVHKKDQFLKAMDAARVKK
jgi:hypothetical protein